jgi:hypothetical protein
MRPALESRPGWLRRTNYWREAANPGAGVMRPSGWAHLGFGMVGRVGGAPGMPIMACTLPRRLLCPTLRVRRFAAWRPLWSALLWGVHRGR